VATAIDRTVKSASHNSSHCLKPPATCRGLFFFSCHFSGYVTTAFDHWISGIRVVIATIDFPFAHFAFFRRFVYNAHRSLE